MAKEVEGSAVKRKTKGKRGRRTKLTKELETIMAQLFEQGNSIKRVCDLVGISEHTYFNWYNRGEREGKGGYFHFFQLMRRSQAVPLAEANRCIATYIRPHVVDDGTKICSRAKVEKDGNGEEATVISPYRTEEIKKRSEGNPELALKYIQHCELMEMKRSQMDFDREMKREELALKKKDQEIRERELKLKEKLAGLSDDPNDRMNPLAYVVFGNIEDSEELDSYLRAQGQVDVEGSEADAG